MDANVNMENYEEYILMYVDKELSKTEVDALMNFLEKHPELKTELKAYEATVVATTDTINYPEKEQLLKTAPKAIRLGNWKYYAAAACVLLAAGIFAIMQMRHQNTQLAIAEGFHRTIEVNQLQRSEPTETQEPTAPPKPTTIAQYSSVPKQPAIIKNNKHTHIVISSINPQPSLMLPQDINITEQVAVNNITSDAMEPVKETPANTFIANSLNLSDRTAGVSELELALNNKIEKVKNIKESIKGTDIVFRLGSKQIFSATL